MIRAIGLMSRVFTNGLGDLGSIPDQVILKTQKMVLDATLLNAQHYKVQIKDKVEQSREWSSTLPLQLGVVAIEKGAFGLPSTKVANLLCIGSCIKYPTRVWYAVKHNQPTWLSFFFFFFFFFFLEYTELVLWLG